MYYTANPCAGPLPPAINPENLETQPVDVMKLPVETSPVPTGSPTLSTSALRAQFQNRPAPPSTDAATDPPVPVPEVGWFTSVMGLSHDINSCQVMSYDFRRIVYVHI